MLALRRLRHPGLQGHSFGDEMRSIMTPQSTLLGIALVLVPHGCSTGKATLEAKTLDELVVEGFEQGLPGVILLVDRPGTGRDFLDAKGSADREAKLDLTPDARFRVASNTKSFVGLALAQLEIEGVLQLDDPVSKWLDAEVIAEIANAESATLRQLLNHSSGIYDYLDDDFEAATEADPKHVWTIDETLAYAHGKAAAFPLGEGHEYSNTNCPGPRSSMLACSIRSAST